jgi:hypothetical protein
MDINGIILQLMEDLVHYFAMEDYTVTTFVQLAREEAIAS